MRDFPRFPIYITLLWIIILTLSIVGGAFK